MPSGAVFVFMNTDHDIEYEIESTVEMYSRPDVRWDDSVKLELITGM